MSTASDNRDLQDAQVAAFKNANDIAAILNEAVSGLLFTSESDYPISVFQLPSTAMSTHSALTVENAESIFLTTPNDMSFNHDSSHREDWTSNIAVEETNLEWFFRRYTVAEEWWEPCQHAELPRWKNLKSIIEDCMVGVTVFRIGQAGDYGLNATIDIFIVGCCRSDSSTWVGLHTLSVET